uniref:Uncharacterized protein n=1 Tax=Syphacia muris TaxID=451379 RepID=A0A0N5AYD2_9BILA
MEVSWALGASYDLIHSFQKRLHQLSALKCEEMKPLNWQTSYGFRSIGIESISKLFYMFLCSMLCHKLTEAVATERLLCKNVLFISTTIGKRNLISNSSLSESLLIPEQKLSLHTDFNVKYNAKCDLGRARTADLLCVRQM